MRNLVVLHESNDDLGDLAGVNAFISNHAYDAISGNSYVTVEKDEGSGHVNVQIIKMSHCIGSSSEIDLLGSCDTEATGKASINLKYLADEEACCLCFNNGDIALARPNELVSIVGTVENGIISAAWSPDEELLAVVTNSHALLLMTRSFDMISESSLLVDDQGEGTQVTVGWGKKETQFHGSEGQAAAKKKVDIKQFGLSPNDDKTIAISWRGDGNFFAVSIIQDSRRLIKVFNREAILQNTSEPVDQLEHPVAWRPSGNLIASTQQLPHRQDVVFFERNGLQHSEFTLAVRHKYQIRQLSWNADSNVLAIWTDRNSEGLVQLWTTGNYHWYLKQEFTIKDIMGLTWHPESPNLLSVFSKSHLHRYELAMDTFIDSNASEDTSACAAVIDGYSILITPFRYSNVPPPMSTFEIPIASVPSYISILSKDNHVFLAVLLPSQECISLYKMAQNGRRIAGPVLIKTVNVPQCFQVVLLSEKIAVALGHYAIHIIDLSGNSHRSIATQRPVYRLTRESNETALVQEFDGTLLHLSIATDMLAAFSKFDEVCPWFSSISIDSEDSDKTLSVVGLSLSGNLFISDKLVMRKCHSYAVSTGYVIIVTTSHLLKFLRLKGELNEVHVPPDSLHNAQVQTVRAVERGARVISVVPKTNSVILQMPRGNLETISPRLLVLSYVMSALDEKKYRDALMTCRKHRIDLNILFDHKPREFIDDMEVFVRQIDNVDYLNLFISGLKNENVKATLYGYGSDVEKHPDKVNYVCDTIRGALEKVNYNGFIQPILTTYVKKYPPDHESALRLLLQLKEQDPQLAEDALKYVVFLTDVNKLFDYALGMYDFSLVLMVASKTQKDPREYLPFLRDLEKLPKYEQRFRIDNHLNRREKALRNLALSDRPFDEVLEYIDSNGLYTLGMEIFGRSNATKLQKIYLIYATHLESKKEWKEAGLIYELAEDFKGAMEAYKKGLLWREALVMATRQQLTPNQIFDLAKDLAEELIGIGEFLDSSTLYLQYLNDLEQAVAVLCKGCQFTEAARVAYKFKRSDLIETHIKTGVIDGLKSQHEDVNEMMDQVTKQLARLRELRLKKQEHPSTFYGRAEENLDNVDVMTDTSTMASGFTRYTSGHTQVSTVPSDVSGRSSLRWTKKQQKKKDKGKKGSVYEEEYLLNSLKRLVHRLNGMHDDILRILEALLRYGYPTRAKSHHGQVESLIQILESELDEAYDGQDVIAHPGTQKVEKPSIRHLECVTII